MLDRIIATCADSPRFSPRRLLIGRTDKIIAEKDQLYSSTIGQIQKLCVTKSKSWFFYQKAEHITRQRHSWRRPDIFLYQPSRTPNFSLVHSTQQRFYRMKLSSFYWHKIKVQTEFSRRSRQKIRSNRKFKALKIVAEILMPTTSSARAISKRVFTIWKQQNQNKLKSPETEGIEILMLSSIRREC